MVLFLIAVWIWFCLVMLPNNHMRLAIFGIFLFIPSLCAIMMRNLFETISEKLMAFNRWFSRL